MIIKSTQILIEKETALKLIDCRKDNPLYDEMGALYDELRIEMEQIIEPKGLLEFAPASEIFLSGEWPNQEEYAIILYTLGNKVTDYISALFEQGEYVKGMLADAMADSCLFTMEEEWSTVLLGECKKRKLGIEKRMEAPQDFSMEIQKRIWKLLDGESMGITMTSGYMFSPAKTICLLFPLTADVCQNNVEHDCRRCANEGCKLRNINIPNI